MLQNFFFFITSLYYKHIMIIKDTSSVVNEWRYNLERHSIVINYEYEASFTLIYGVYSTGITHDDR